MSQFLKGAGDTAKLSAALVGTIVGAGFISGAELVRFFPSKGFVPYAYIAAGLFFLCFFLLFRVGKAYGGYEGALSALFGRAAPVFRTILLACSLVMCGSMLAGINATVREGFGLKTALPVASLAALALLYGLSHKGVKGIFAVNLALVPVILAFVAAYAFRADYGGVAYGAEGGPFASLCSVILYVAMNAFLAAPVVCDAGAKSGGAGGCAVASALIGFCIAAVLANISQEGAGALSSELPFLYVVGKSAALGNLFSAVCLCGILTTLFSSYYPLHNCVNGTRRAPLWRALFCVAAFLLSVLGLRQIVRVFYPLVGAAGSAFFAVCALRFLSEQRRSRKRNVQAPPAEDKGGPCRAACSSPPKT